MTPVTLVAALPASAAPHGLRVSVNGTPQPPPWRNSSTWPPPTQALGFGMTCFTLVFGAISNLVALAILARLKPSRGQSKAPFVLLTVVLLLTDLGGHVILGSFALYMHVCLYFRKQLWQPSEPLCKIFGASMVFFGLYPLLLGGAMAVERCVAITKPFVHNSKMSLSRVRRLVALLLCAALLVATLPLFDVGTYTCQYPGTWCFLQVHSHQSTADRVLVLAFCSVGLAALSLSLLCNVLSGLALLQARMRSHRATSRSVGLLSRRTSSASTSSSSCSLNVEMLAQLAAITVILCICWSPFLVSTCPVDGSVCWLLSFHFYRTRFSSGD